MGGDGVKLLSGMAVISWVRLPTETINADPKPLFVTAELRLKTTFFSEDFIPGSMQAPMGGGYVKLTKWDGNE
jgi:hypothetical protein